jgi:hypothetical protein
MAAKNRGLSFGFVWLMIVSLHFTKHCALQLYSSIVKAIFSETKSFANNTVVTKSYNEILPIIT